MQKGSFFEELLRTAKDQSNVSVFIDADENTFQHVLRYLRDRVLPLFWDRKKGHDYALYLAVWSQAKRFRIVDLEKWIEDQDYLQVIKTYYSAEEMEDSGRFRGRECGSRISSWIPSYLENQEGVCLP